MTTLSLSKIRNVPEVNSWHRWIYQHPIPRTEIFQSSLIKSILNKSIIQLSLKPNRKDFRVLQIKCSLSNPIVAENCSFPNA